MAQNKWLKIKNILLIYILSFFCIEKQFWIQWTSTLAAQFDGCKDFTNTALFDHNIWISAAGHNFIYQIRVRYATQSGKDSVI